MQRIAIVGGSRIHRTGVATVLAGALDLPTFHVGDALRRPTSTAPLDLWHRGPRWIISGWGPWPVVTRRLEAADTVVFLDVLPDRLFDSRRRASVLQLMRRPSMTLRLLHLQSRHEIDSLLSCFRQKCVHS